ncbi:MAG: RpiB/LacA/LacB family sugar-phosphate isomerase [Spirochaetota bacterium]
MLIYIGADHKGFNLKESLKNFLEKKGYEVIDVGNAKFDENDDYPDFAKLVGDAISQDPMTRKGILICGSGVGVDIVANKFKGVRSSLVFNPNQAFLARNDDDANVLSLPADFLNEEDIEKILGTWLVTAFSGKESYKRRIEKIGGIENKI